MNIADASSRIDVVVHTGPSEWWQIVAALTPSAVILGITALIAWYAFLRPASKRGTGMATRADCWDRTQWALDMALDDQPERRKMGLAALEQLSSSHLMSSEDERLVAEAKVILNP